ncbi:DddA-like double-stranded DNA deaminase toxin [Streptomyces sp. E5N91]|uniref:DddA-like double-stranded DNA deaminase toxin n=1 Tax=Streptomyces sp. E5N91 TaxID=1851996 RepID=UPI001EE81A8C|nr:DddA-like double-stranded DNA deaminase toxin [Streptomyces sp. E5N91]
MLANLPGRTRQNFDHVETHAAAFLRMNPGIRKAVLYIDNKFGMCTGPSGCAARMEDMVPEGVQVWVNSRGRKYGPFTGNAN